MKRELFGHRKKNPSNIGRVPGSPYGGLENEYGDMSALNRSESQGHMKYKNPGYSKHNIRFPEDEPHMRSHMNKGEYDEAEENYHMKTPDQTEDTLPPKIKRARMIMDEPDYGSPKPLRGNIVHNVPYEGEEDTSGEEMEGPNEMQSEMSKGKRKKMIVAVMKKKMNRDYE